MLFEFWGGTTFLEDEMLGKTGKKSGFCMARSFSLDSWCLFSINVPGSTDEWWNKVGREDESKRYHRTSCCLWYLCKNTHLTNDDFRTFYSVCRKVDQYVAWWKFTPKRHGWTPARCHWIGFVPSKQAFFRELCWSWCKRIKKERKRERQQENKSRRPHRYDCFMVQKMFGCFFPIW